jgi:long-subunit fatty acid transport protein
VDIFSHNGSYAPLNFLHIVSPIRVKGHHVVLNVGYTRNFDVYYKFGGNLFGDWSGNAANSFYERTGGINAVNLAFGTRVARNLSVGLATNIYFGKVVTEESRLFERIGYNPAIGSATYTSSVTVLDSTQYTGFNATLGLLYRTEKFGAGLTLRSPFKLRGESDTSLYIISKRNGITIPFDDWDLPGFGIFRTDTIYVDDISSRMEIPLIVGLGLSYRPNDNWLFAADFEMRNFSGKQIENLVFRLLQSDGTSEEIYTDTLNRPNWNDVVQFRIGGEYLIDTKLGTIPIRAGYRNEAFPGGNISSVENRFGEQETGEDSSKVFYIFDYAENKITGYSVSFGTGIHWSQIFLDFAYTYTSFDQTIYSSPDVLHSENDWKNHHMNFTFTGFF